jgi:hypothetical protein
LHDRENVISVLEEVEALLVWLIFQDLMARTYPQGADTMYEGQQMAKSLWRNFVSAERLKSGTWCLSVAGAEALSRSRAMLFIM